MVVSIFIIASGERISIQEARIDRVRLRSHAAPPKAHEYQCKWGEKSTRPTAISQPLHHTYPFQSRQMALFDPLWIRYPVDLATQSFRRSEKKQSTAHQLRLYFGPELV